MWRAFAVPWEGVCVLDVTGLGVLLLILGVLLWVLVTPLGMWLALIGLIMVIVGVARRC